MPIFAAIKIHYDHRSSLAPHLKYSVVPSYQEYQNYLTLFQDESVGGNGFHECINFAVGGSDKLKFYLPPTCIPAEKYNNEEFLFFSFTYKGDPEMPAHIVGVHAGARLLDRKGRERGESFNIDGAEPLIYHSVAPSNLVTLITPPLPYDMNDGVYTPVLSKWGYGQRYIGGNHASNIVHAAISQALRVLAAAGESEKAVIERQLDVLRRISSRYGLRPDGEAIKPAPTGNAAWIGLPDTELGYLGERCVYERELDYVTSIGQPPSEVQWTSQGAPTSPFDIRTLRKTQDGVREHFLEVKSSAMAEGENVYISSGQLKFFEKNRDRAAFALVIFGPEGTPSIREVTLDELHAVFDLQPVKYKLMRRA